MVGAALIPAEANRGWGPRDISEASPEWSIQNHGSLLCSDCLPFCSRGTARLCSSGPATLLVLREGAKLTGNITF